MHSHFSNWDGAGQHVVGLAGGLGHRDVDHARRSRVGAAPRASRWLSASEWTGLPDSTSIARKRSGWSVEDLVGDHVARHETGDEPVAGDRRDGSPPPLPAPPPPTERGEARCAGSSPPVHAEVAGEQDDQLLEVAVERRVRRHLDAEVLEDRHAAGGRADHVGGRRAPAASATPRLGARLGDVDPRRGASRSSSRPLACSASQVVVDQVLVDEDREQRGQAGRRRRPGCRLEVDVGQVGRSRCAAGR